MLRRNPWRAVVIGGLASIMTIVGLIPTDQTFVRASAPLIAGNARPANQDPSTVTVESIGDGSFQYLVNGTPQVFIGIGYNPIYRYLTDEERAQNYDRDFRMMCEAGVNHITGWDADKGYDQDKFDELTLDRAQKFGIGVVMPFYLPPDGDYSDEAFKQQLMDEASAKIARFKNHPALRMWGVGNEVLEELDSWEARASFGRFYLELADLFHTLDPNHPVILREAEDTFVASIANFIASKPPERPWLLYGMNAYTPELERLLDNWPSYDFGRPLFVTEFGADPNWPGGRDLGYISMWRMIRAHPSYVLGGAPYAWTTDGPEPTDSIWGLMDADSNPVDDAFAQLKDDWLKENGGPRDCPA